MVKIEAASWRPPMATTQSHRIASALVKDFNSNMTSATATTRLCVPSNFYPVGIGGYFSRVKATGLKLVIHFYVVPKSRKRGAVPPQPLIFITWCSLKHRNKFNLAARAFPPALQKFYKLLFGLRRGPPTRIKPPNAFIFTE
jgi:hypothetical protein